MAHGIPFPRQISSRAHHAIATSHPDRRRADHHLRKLIGDFVRGKRHPYTYILVLIRTYKGAFCKDKNTDGRKAALHHDEEESDDRDAASDCDSFSPSAPPYDQADGAVVVDDYSFFPAEPIEAAAPATPVPVPKPRPPKVATIAGTNRAAPTFAADAGHGVSLQLAGPPPAPKTGSRRSCV